MIRSIQLIQAKMREKQKNSPLAKFLPGGALSSTERHHEKEAPESSVMENEMIEQLQLELEEARRTIRSHEGKIMQLQEGWRSFWTSYDSFLSHLLTGSEVKTRECNTCQLIFNYSHLTISHFNCRVLR